jgi:predicted metalloprotease with PDZ domain
VGAELEQPEKEIGILVKEVMEGSAAQKAGLQPGDVIVTYQGKQITDPVYVEKDVEVSPVGRRIEMTIIRGERPLLMEMVIERKRSRVVNVAPPGETPDYSVAITDYLWVGSYPYPVSYKEVADVLKLLPKAIQDHDQRPFVPATVFSITVR